MAELIKPSLAFTSLVAGSQMKQLGEDKTPFDASKKENVEHFQRDVETWMSEMQSGKREVGYVDITMQSLPYLPYAGSTTLASAA